jgi:hypothetical protein
VLQYTNTCCSPALDRYTPDRQYPHCLHQTHSLPTLQPAHHGEKKTQSTNTLAFFPQAVVEHPEVQKITLRYSPSIHPVRTVIDIFQRIIFIPSIHPFFPQAQWSIRSAGPSYGYRNVLHTDTGTKHRCLSKESYIHPLSSQPSNQPSNQPKTKGQESTRIPKPQNATKRNKKKTNKQTQKQRICASIKNGKKTLPTSMSPSSPSPRPDCPLQIISLQRKKKHTHAHTDLLYNNTPAARHPAARHAPAKPPQTCHLNSRRGYLPLPYPQHGREVSMYIVAIAICCKCLP